MLNGVFSCYAECRYAECRYAECHYAECHYGKYQYAECRGADNLSCLKVKNREDIKQSQMSMTMINYVIQLSYALEPILQKYPGNLLLYILFLGLKYCGKLQQYWVLFNRGPMF